MGYSQDLNEVRRDFHDAVKYPEQSEDFNENLVQFDSSNPTICAYKATSEALMARVLWNPFSKLGRVKEYDRIMNKAIEKDPNNLEIRFLRMSIQYHLPSFLGMSENIQEDKQYILNNTSQIEAMNVDKSFSDYIFYFIESTGLCTVEEISDLKGAFGM